MKVHKLYKLNGLQRSRCSVLTEISSHYNWESARYYSLEQTK